MKLKDFSYAAAVVLPVVALTIYMGITRTNSTPTPTIYPVGTCFQMQDTEVEKWESPAPIMQILEIGKQSYRICVAPCSINSSGFSESFRAVSKYYSVVECPKN